MLLAGSVAWADFGATEAEFRAWPDYCRAKYTVTNIGQQLGFGGRVSAVEMQRAQALLGRFFVHVHHYCWALAEERRMHRARNEQTRRHWLNAALGDAVYALNRIDPENVLYPDVAALVARLRFAQGQREKAFGILERAMKARPQASSLYLTRAHLLRKVGALDKARETLQAGLQRGTRHNATYHHLFALVCLELGDKDCAREQGELAYRKGYPLPGLRNRLRREGVMLNLAHPARARPEARDDG